MDLHFFIPGDLNALTGGYIYDKRIVEGLRLCGNMVRLHSLASDFPFPSSESKLQCQKSIRSLPKGEIVIFDSLVFGSIPELLREIKHDNPIVALIHLPLSMNTTFVDEKRKSVSILEKEAFALANLIIVTSHFTEKLLLETGVDQSLIKVVIPGAEAHLHKKYYKRLPRELITVSNYTRNKGYLHLINALSNLKHLNWQLNCYGNIYFDPEYVKELSDLIVENNLSDRIFLHSSISGYELSEAYIHSDLLIHPSGFESYGMVLVEALVHGIPVITSKGGAITQTVPASMGVFFDADDKNSLGKALAHVFTDENLFKKLCNETSKYIHGARRWEKSVKEFEEVLLALL